MFLDGDLLYSTYNNCFPIRSSDQGKLEVGVGFNGSGGPWLLLSNIANAIPSSVNFERHYIQNAKLEKDEEQNIIKLANQCGIATVAKISTHYFRPSSNRTITVQSIEEIEGRVVCCKSLELKYAKWWTGTDGPQPGDKQLGEFWAGKAQSQKPIILKVGKKEYRTRSIAGLTAEECETILAAFLKGSYTAARENANQLKQVDWTNPSVFCKRGDTISVSFPHKQEGAGFFDLQFQQIKPRIMLTEVMQAVP